MTLPIIYLDILVILNWLIDYLLLHTTAFFLHLPYRRARILFGAALGGASACFILIELSIPLNVLLNAATALLLCAVAFRWQGFGRLLRNACVFFIVSAAFSGIAGAVWIWLAPKGFFMIQGVVYYDISAAALIALVVFSYLLMRLAERLLRKRIPAGHLYPMRIVKNGIGVDLSAMFDTGASPVDVFSGKPVVIAEREPLLSVLPPDFPPPAVREVPLGVRLIPVRTISGQTLLPAFAADEIYINTRKVGSVYVAVIETLDRAQCQALFGRELGDHIKE